MAVLHLALHVPSWELTCPTYRREKTTFPATSIGEDMLVPWRVVRMRL